MLALSGLTVSTKFEVIFINKDIFEWDFHYTHGHTPQIFMNETKLTNFNRENVAKVNSLVLCNNE